MVNLLGLILSLSIGRYAFYQCGCNGNLNLPNSINIIEDSTFYGCKFTGDLYLPTVTTIGDNAFYDCNGFTGDLYLPTVITIGDNAFYDCSGFTGSLLPSIETIQPYASTNFILLSTYIGDSAFFGCSGLTGDLYLSNIYEIGDNAFFGTNFTNVYLEPNQLLILGNNIFSNNPTIYAHRINEQALRDAGIINVVFYEPSNICFPANTIVKTDQGAVYIQRITTLHTISGDMIQYISRTISKEEYLVQIDAHALDINYPNQPTRMSLNHKVFYKNKWIKAEKLVNHTTIHFIPYTGELLYNIRLTKNKHMYIHGLTVESLL